MSLKSSVFIITALLLLSSCTATKINSFPESNTAKKVTINRHKQHKAFIQNLTTYSNDIETNANPSFKERLSTKFRNSGIFKDVSSYPIESRKKIVLDLVIKETSNDYSFSNILKASFTGASLFTLTPILTLKFKFSSDMELIATRPDGKSKTFKTNADGITKATLFSFAKKSSSLTSEITNRNINSLVNQMIENKQFFIN